MLLQEARHKQSQGKGITARPLLREEKILEKIINLWKIFLKRETETRNLYYTGAKQRKKRRKKVPAL